MKKEREKPTRPQRRGPAQKASGGARARRLPVPGVIGLLLAAVLLTLWIWLPSPGGPQPWSDSDAVENCNVLLISLDTTRPDWLAACGGAPVATPALDRLAGGGFRFQEMTTPAPITLPAHASLFTGWDPPRHGVRENTEYALPPGIPTLAEAFTGAGYQTAAIVASFVLDSRFGLDRGFDEYEDRLDGPEPGLRPATVELPGSVVASRASAWIQRYAASRTAGSTKGETPAPFFLFVHFFDAHAPYTPPAGPASQYPGNAYAGELAYQDQCLGQILDTLENSGEAERTLIWVVSDHGESLGEHGEATHSLFIYDATLRVVSVLAPPARSGRYEPGPPRLDITAACSLVDIAPTLCRLLGIETGAFRPGAADGRDLGPLLRGAPLDDEVASLRQRAVYAETWSPYVSYHWSPLQGMRTPEEKLIRAPIPEFYELLDDPKEETNLASARPEAVANLETALTDHLDTIASTRNGGAADANNAGGNSAPPAQRQASAEELERLRSLGYLAGSSSPSSKANSPEIDIRTLPDPKRMLGFFHSQFQQAKTLLLSGKYDDAVSAFEEAKRIDPANTSVHLFLAGALRQAGRHPEASASYREALRLAPTSPRAWFGLGRSLLLESKPDSAVNAFARALQLLPESPDHWMGLGEAEYARGAYENAVHAFQASLDRGGPADWLHGMMARIYLEALDDPSAGDLHLRAFAAQRGLTLDAARSSLPDL